MEDLWRVHHSGLDVNDVEENMAEYKRFIDRFNKEEEATNRRNMLYGNMAKEAEAPDEPNNK